MTSHLRSNRGLATLLALGTLAATVCQGAPLKEVKPLENAKRSEVMSGSFSGMVVPLFLPPGVVRSWLPPGLQLASECPYQDRPVIVMFGSIDDLAREKLVTVKPRFGRHFLETFVAVPYLRLEAAHRAAGQSSTSCGSIPTVSKGPPRASASRAGPRSTRPSRPPTTPTASRPRAPGTVLGAQMDFAHLKPVGAGNHSLRQVEAMLSQPLVLRHEGVYNIYTFDFHFEQAIAHLDARDPGDPRGFHASARTDEGQHAGNRRQRFRRLPRGLPL